MNDADALRRSRSDPEAISALYDRYVARLVAALTRAGGDPEGAFDVAQETFARTMEYGHRVRLPTEGSAWPWLWTVTRNLLHDRQRRDVVDAGARQRLGIGMVAFDEQAIEALIARVDAEQLNESLAAALNELPFDQTQAVVGRIVAGLSYERLALGLGASEQACVPASRAACARCDFDFQEASHERDRRSDSGVPSRVAIRSDA